MAEVVFEHKRLDKYVKLMREQPHLREAYVLGALEDKELHKSLSKQFSIGDEDVRRVVIGTSLIRKLRLSGAAYDEVQEIFEHTLSNILQRLQERPNIDEKTAAWLGVKLESMLNEATLGADMSATFLREIRERGFTPAAFESISKKIDENEGLQRFLAWAAGMSNIVELATLGLKAKAGDANALQNALKIITDHLRMVNEGLNILERYAKNPKGGNVSEEHLFEAWTLLHALMSPVFQSVMGFIPKKVRREYEQTLQKTHERLLRLIDSLPREELADKIARYIVDVHKRMNKRFPGTL